MMLNKINMNRVWFDQWNKVRQVYFNNKAI